MADAPGSKIYHFVQARIPELRFEWHPICGVVYVVQKNTAVIQADPFAWSIKDHGAAWNAVLIWCRGYMAHRLDYAAIQSVDQREEGKWNGRPV